MAQNVFGLFHQELSSYLEKNGCIDTYQDLFKKSIPLERRLLAISPRMYRGLPRVYHRDRPFESRIKKEFTDWTSLETIASENQILKNYETACLSSTSRICFFTWVIWDGWGDYLAAFEAIQIVQKKLPNLEIHWVLLVCSKKELPSLPVFCNSHLIFYDQQSPVSLFPESVLQILRSSALIVQIPTYYPSTKELCATLKTLVSPHPLPRFISIGEYGFLESVWFHPKTANRSMGLHFLEKGILVRISQKTKNFSFKQIENKQLLEWIFLLDKDERQYLATHHFYMAYLATPLGGAIYLHALMKAHEGSSKTLDLCCPDVGWLIAYIELQSKANLPITEAAQLQLYTREKVYELGVKEGAQKVRIFAPGPISSADFSTLIQLSGPFVAVRGDQSFSEVISIHKPFFYDGREHARYFIKDLLALAENRISSYKSSLTIFRKMGEAFLHNVEREETQWVDETYFQERKPWRATAQELGEALQDPQFSLGFERLSHIIHQEHVFNDFLCQLIQKELYSQQRLV